jgi:predicted amidohydrolase
MTNNLTIIKAAVVQAAPVLFHREATVEKACNLVKEAAREGAKLILFPEAFIPAYPRGLSFGSVVGSRTSEGRELWKLYRDNAVDIPGPTIEQLGKAAREAGAFLALGVIERDSRSKGTLYCTLVYFGPDGQLLGKHRKLKPTAAERIIWGTDYAGFGMQIAAAVKGLRDFQIPEDMREGYGYPEITDEDRRKMFGENLARLIGIQPKRRIGLSKAA